METQTRTVYRFVPQEDITAFELAKILPWIVGGPHHEEEAKARYDALPPGAQRHIKVEQIAK